MAESVRPGTAVNPPDANAVYALGSSAGESARLQRQAGELAADSADLINVPDPAGVTAEMARLARPGGWVASMEPDTEHALCYPAHPAFDRLSEIFTAAFRRNGADPWIGRRVPELFRRAGLDDVGVEARVQMYPPGNSRRTVRLDLVRAMRPQVLEMGLASATELDELDEAARAHLLDPRTVAMSGLLFLTWGRKPGAG